MSTAIIAALQGSEGGKASVGGRTRLSPGATSMPLRSAVGFSPKEAITGITRLYPTGVSGVLRSRVSAKLITSVLAADPGSYGLTGFDADTLLARVLAAESGTLTLTGSEAATVAARLLAAEPGTLTLTGVDAVLARQRIIDAVAGSYGITGAEAAVLLSRVLDAESGTLTLTGVEASLVHEERLGGFTRLHPTGVSGVLRSRVTAKPAVTLALDQEGFRFRNDDGDEANATWKAAQDANISLTPGVAFRLRMLIDATGDPASAQFKLQFRKDGGSWRDIS